MEAQKHLILAVDDNKDSIYTLEKMLKAAGFEVISAPSGKEALLLLEQKKPSVVLLDVMMPEMDGYQVAKQIKVHASHKYIPVIMLSAKDSLDDVVLGLEKGADGYITKPFQPEELIARVKAAIRLKSIYEELQSSEKKVTILSEKLSKKEGLDAIIGQSPEIKKVKELIAKVAPSDSSILITGPSGTGKELVAKAIHYASKRSGGPFIAQNCATFSETLLESELFGHVKGAFTGAMRDKEGLIEAADGGTLFLDEIGEMPITLQAKLLRVLQEGTFFPVGSSAVKKVNVRILSATNKNLEQMIEEGKFRDDLFYRLNVINIEVPPLKDRKSDIPLLIEHFLKELTKAKPEGQYSLSEKALSYLTNYAWPGNIRELRNEIERMMILSEDDQTLDESLLSSRITRNQSPSSDPSAPSADEGTLKCAIEKIEKEMIHTSLKENNWNKSQVAKVLGISRSNLISKVQYYGLEDKEGE